MEPMEVIVRDRREGKTTELVNWLLQGKQLEPYPGWSRVIVSAHTTMLRHTTQLVKDLVTYRPPWEGGFEFRNDQYLPHVHMEPKQFADLDQRLRVDVCKAVWSIEDFTHVSRGAPKDLDYAIDDVDLLIQRFMPPYRPPALIAMTGRIKT